MLGILNMIVGALNFFPGLKTKAGAVLQVIGTGLLAYNAVGGSFGLPLVPVELVIAINAAAATLIAVGAANQPANVKPPSA
jgi:predicted tellurium resistance membrane protein TerC